MDSDFPEWWRSLRRPRTHIPFCDKLREFTPIPEEYSCVLVRLLPYGLFRDKLQEFTWREFEKLVSDLLQQLGADPEISPAGANRGIDILCRETDGDFIVQCKRWKAKVGEPTVKKVYTTAIWKKVKGAIIVTKSDFSDRAKSIVIDLCPPPVILINGEDLFHLMNQHMRSVLEEVLKGIWKSQREARIKHKATP